MLWTEYETRKSAAPKTKGKQWKMVLTRDSKKTVSDRAKRDPAFAKALLDEALTLFLNGEPDTARLVLRDLVNATVGFERLATATGKPAKSLHRMLSPKGNRAWTTSRSSSGRFASGFEFVYLPGR